MTTPNTEQEQKECWKPSIDEEAMLPAMRAYAGIVGEVSFGAMQAALVAYEAARATPAQPDKPEVVDDVQYAGGDLDELPMAQKGDTFLDTIIAKIPQPVTVTRYNCTSHTAGDSISARILWDMGTPIAGFFVLRNEMNCSRLVTWDGLAALPPHRDDSGLVEALKEVVGCFEAAHAEGLEERLAEANIYDVGSLADLVFRRLLHALPPAQQALAEHATQAKAGAQ